MVKSVLAIEALDAGIAFEMDRLVRGRTKGNSDTTAAGAGNNG